MSTIDTTINMLQGLSDKELQKVNLYITRVLIEKVYPYQQLTREELLEELKTAKEHAEQGRVMAAHTASSNVREKYGL